MILIKKGVETRLRATLATPAASCERKGAKTWIPEGMIIRT